MKTGLIIGFTGTFLIGILINASFNYDISSRFFGAIFFTCLGVSYLSFAILLVLGKIEHGWGNSNSSLGQFFIGIPSLYLGLSQGAANLYVEEPLAFMLGTDLWIPEFMFAVLIGGLVIEHRAKKRRQGGAGDGTHS